MSQFLLSMFSVLLSVSRFSSLCLGGLSLYSQWLITISLVAYSVFKLILCVFSGLSLCSVAHLHSLGCLMSMSFQVLVSYFFVAPFLCLGYSSPVQIPCLLCWPIDGLNHFSLILGHYLGVPVPMALCLVALSLAWSLISMSWFSSLCLRCFILILHCSFLCALVIYPSHSSPYLSFSSLHLDYLFLCLSTCFHVSCFISLYLSCLSLGFSGVHFYFHPQPESNLDNIFLLCPLTLKLTCSKSKWSRKLFSIAIFWNKRYPCTVCQFVRMVADLLHSSYLGHFFF